MNIDYTLKLFRYRTEERMTSLDHRKCFKLRKSYGNHLLACAGEGMTSEEAERMMLGWSREKLARISEVDVASVYLFERMGSAGSEDDLRIKQALAQALDERLNQAQSQSETNDNDVDDPILNRAEAKSHSLRPPDQPG